MEEEVRGELEEVPKHWKTVLWRKVQLARFREVAAVVLFAGLIIWLLTYAFLYQIDRFTYGPQVQREATAEYVKSKFVDLIPVPHEDFEMRFYHPGVKVWNFRFRPLGTGLSFNSFLEHARSHGWKVTTANPLELYLEKGMTQNEKLLARAYRLRSEGKLDVWVTQAPTYETASQRWSRVDMQISVGSQPRRGY